MGFGTKLCTRSLLWRPMCMSVMLGGYSEVHNPSFSLTTDNVDCFQLLPAPDASKHILSALNKAPIGDALTTFIIPRSKSTKHVRGTNRMNINPTMYHSIPSVFISH
eukprot:525820_1